MTEMLLVDVSNWTPNVTYDEGLKLCEKLGLIETLTHGEHDYGRLTQTGINVLRVLMVMAGHAADPKNTLKGS
jgi:hypothetical protein